ncbi:MAG: hypothetical protein ACHBN1_03175 [Heteroscytonema crispum UTEX LB 1556]
MPVKVLISAFEEVGQRVEGTRHTAGGKGCGRQGTMGGGDKVEISLFHYPMPNAPCPMPHAQCSMPNAQCPIPINS